MKNKKNSSMLRSKSRAIALEPRLLFDGAGAVGVADAFDDTYAEPEQNQHDAGHNDTDSNGILNGDELHVPGGASPSTLVIIDSRVDEFQSLLADLPANTVVRVVDSEESGLAAISDELAKGGNFDAVHIFSHGTPGSFTLGSDQVDSSTLANQAEQLQGWSLSLTEEADILLYGCDVAQGEAGQAFISELAHLTGADIAASTNATGAADQGGDWVLESETGSIEAEGFEFGVYGGLLGEPADGSISSVTNTAEDPVVTVGEDDEPTKILGDWEVKGTGQITVELTGAGKGTLSGGASKTGTAAEINTWLENIQYQYKTTGQSEVGDTDSITLKFTTYSGETSTVRTETQAINIAPQNDAPTVPAKTQPHTHTGLKVEEGKTLESFGAAVVTTDGVGFTHELLGISDPDNLAEQVIIKLTEIPSKDIGKFVLNGVTLEAGSSFSVADLANLTFVLKEGAQVLPVDGKNPVASFTYTIDDGAGERIEGNKVDIELIPVNEAPSISGSVTIIQGEGAVSIGGGGKLPVLGNGAIDRGKIEGVDPEIAAGLTGETLSYKITELPTVGVLFYNGTELTGTNFATVEITDLSELTYEYPVGKEPQPLGDDPVVTFKMQATDSGGGEGVGAAKTSEVLTVSLTILDNNNDPVIEKNISQNYQDLVDASKVTDSSFVVTTDMLNVTDPDSFDSNIVFNITSEVADSAGGYFTLNGKLLSKDTAFTLKDIKEGHVKYHLRSSPGGTDRIDSFDFTVIDSGKGIIFPDVGVPFARDGGIYDADGNLQVHRFEVKVPGVVGDGSGGVLPALPDKAGNLVNTGNSTMDGVLESQGTAPTTSGVQITDAMLNTADGGITPPAGIVYRIETLPSSGSIWLTEVDETDVEIGKRPLNQFDSFTQADINAGRVEFRHAGGEKFTDQLLFSVSNGTTTTAVTGELDITIVPQNDTPEASQKGEINVLEGSAITITGAYIGLSDRDVADAAGGYANKNDLWFEISGLPDTAVGGDYVGEGTTPTVVGKLQWNTGGDTWVDITASNINTFNGDGKITTQNLQDGKLRYVHNGTEDFADSFKITPYDNQDVVGAGITPTNQTSQGDEVEINITVAPVNNAPVLKAGAKEELTGDLALYEGQSAIIGGNGATPGQGQLVFADQDNSSIQNQFRVTKATQYGTLTKDGVALKVGSIFTQKDLDEGKIEYTHNGSDTRADKFEYTVSDGDYTVNDNGVIGEGNIDSSVFNIHIKPTNDKPEFAAKPNQPVIVDGTDSRHNIVNGFQVKDIDLVTVDEGEKDLITVIVRVVDSTGKMLTDKDYNLSVVSDNVTGTKTANKNYLQLTGTVADVNAALKTLGVGFTDDLNSSAYKLQVIVDDRLNVGQTAYQNGGAGVSANGGDLNQNGLERANVDITVYDWTAAVITAETSLNLNVAEVVLWVSTINESSTFTGPSSVTVNEDVPGRVNGFVVSDPESKAFNTPVTVTISVPDGQGALQVGKGEEPPTSITPTGGQEVKITNNGTHELKLTGRAEDIQAVLNGLSVAEVPQSEPAESINTGLHYTSALNANHDQNNPESEPEVAGDVTLTLKFSDEGSRFGGDEGDGKSTVNNPGDITVALDITAINDAPTVTKPEGESVSIDSTDWTDVGAFTVTDVDSSDGYVTGEADGIIQVTVRVLDKNGDPLTADKYTTSGINFQNSTAPAGVTVEGGVGAALQVRGTLTDVQAYLDNLQVQFADAEKSNLDGTYKVEVIVDDRLRNTDGSFAKVDDKVVANGGKQNQNGVNAPTDISDKDDFDIYATKVSDYKDGGTKVFNVVSNTRDIFISAINDPAEIGINGEYEVGKNQLEATETDGNNSVTLDGITIQDSDAQPNDELTVTVTVPEGFTFDAGTTGGTVSYGGKSIELTGTLTELNAKFKEIKINLPDVAGDAAQQDWNGSFTLNVQVNDKGNTGVTGDSYDTENGNTFVVIPASGDDKKSITTSRDIVFVVKPTNDAPVAKVPVDHEGGLSETLPAVLEDSEGTTVAETKTVEDLFKKFFDDSRDEIKGNQVTGADGTGTEADSFWGIAIVGNASTSDQGTWQYHNGTDWVDLPSDLGAGKALLLNAGTALQFVPQADWNGEPGQLTVRLIENNDNNDTTSTKNITFTSGTTASLAAVNGGVGGTSQFSDETITLGTFVTGVNDAPVATPDTHTINENTASVEGGLITQPTGANKGTTGVDTDVDLDEDLNKDSAVEEELNVVEVKNSAGTAGTNTGGVITIDGVYGKLTVQPDGSYTYELNRNDPNVNQLIDGQSLTETFDYTINDKAGESASSQLTITITGDDDGGSSITPEDHNGGVTGQNTVNEKGLSNGSGDAADATTTGKIDFTAGNGLDKITIGGTEVTLDALEAIFPSDPTTHITLTVTGGTLVITGFNPDTGYEVPVSGSIDYSYTLTQAQTHADGDGANTSTIDISLTVTDKGGKTDTGSLTIAVIDDVPIANDDVVNLGNGDVSEGDVFENDVKGADGATVTGVVKGAETSAAGNVGDTGVAGDYGTLILNADGTYTYTRNDTVVDGGAEDIFTYTITDNDGDTSTAKITIEIGNKVPKVTDGTDPITPDAEGRIIVTPDGSVNESGLPNGSDPKLGERTTTGTITYTPGDGDHSVTVNDQPVSKGSVIETPNGKVTITDIQNGGIKYTYELTQPTDKGTKTTDEFEVSIKDEDGDEAEVTVKVNIINDKPTATPDTGKVVQGQTVTGNVVTNDKSGADGWKTGGAVVGVAEGASTNNTGVTTVTTTLGTLTLNPNGSYTYVANEGVGGDGITDVFTYTVRDADGDETTATLTIAISDNTPPEANNDSATTDEDTPVSGNILTNDKDPDGDPITVTEITVGGTTTKVPTDGSNITITVPGKGKITVNKNGGYTFTPNPGVIGQIPDIGYKITDGNGGDDSAKLTINVRPGNPPVAPPPSNPVDGGFNSPLTSPADPIRPRGLMDSAVITDPSVFYEGERWDDVRRLPIPLQPIVYVNNEVATAQQQRAADDMRASSAADQTQPFVAQSTSLAMGLGQDHNLFVSHAIRDAQQTAQGLDSRVSGRLSRTDLSADDMLFTPDLRSPQPLSEDADEANKAKKKQAPVIEENEEDEGEVALQMFEADEAELFTEQGAMPVAASFTEQLRGNSKHLPFAAREKNFLI